jgi:hypothetical protein
MENNKGFKVSQYACAVLLIVSSIALVTYQVVHIDDVAAGLLYYVAQSFLLAGSIFGLDQIVMGTSTWVRSGGQVFDLFDINKGCGSRFPHPFFYGAFVKYL